MTDLLDVNVWLALADSDHTHHGVASTYWMEQEASEVAFCRVSIMGFLRLITHAALAITSGCRLVSFDADFQMFEGLNFRHLALT